MNLILLSQRIEKLIREFFEKNYSLDIQPQLEPPEDPSFGDLTSPILFKVANLYKNKLSDVSERLIEHIKADSELKEFVEEIKTERNYLNFILSKGYFERFLASVIESPCLPFPNFGGGKKVLIEYVSANPTGPLNVANARAAAIGQTLFNLYKKLGFDVNSEYYVNDGGGQIKALEETIEYLLGERKDFPEDGYRGEYMVHYVQKVKKLERKQRVQELVKLILNDQLEELKMFGAEFDFIVRESEFHLNGENNRLREFTLRVLEAYKSNNMLTEENGTIFLRTDLFGDEKPRVLIRTTGEPTYFLYDIAYHLYKLSRGYDILINLWGPDHLGHLNRMKIALDMLGKALGDEEKIRGDKLKVVIVQYVHLMRSGRRIPMSKRKGEYYTMRELMEEVKRDTAKFFFLMRSTSQPLDFDIDLATKISMENPLFYVQYLHARAFSLENHGRERGITPNYRSVHTLNLMEEVKILRTVNTYPYVLKITLEKLEPHYLAYFLLKLADLFHSYYQKVRIVNPDEQKLSEGRLSLAKVVRWITKSFLEIMGIEAPTHM